MDSDDEIFDIRKDSLYDSEYNSSKLTTDQHYKVLKEISSSFFNLLSTNSHFNIKYTWSADSQEEPIALNFQPNETLAGVFDIIRSDNIFINKVISVYTILACEMNNLIDNDSLLPLLVYGESENELEDGDAENQIARMLNVFTELLEKVTKLLSIAINIMNQTIALYNKKSKSYNDSFKNINLFIPFEYVGKIISFFLTIDTLVTDNENLTNHWRLYRIMFHRCKSDTLGFGFTEDQGKKLERIIKKIEVSIMSGKLTHSCLKHIADNTGLLNLDGSLMPLTGNKEFTSHFNNYLKTKIEKLNNEFGSLTETNERIQLFHLISLFSYYCKVYDNAIDKNLYKSLWAIQKKIIDIQILSHVNFNIEKFLTQIRPSGLNISLDPKVPSQARMELLGKFVQNFKAYVSNIRLQLFTWISRIESDLFCTRLEENAGKVINHRLKLLVNGVVLAYQIKNNLTFCLNTHLSQAIDLSGELIAPICTCLELLKVIEFQFTKLRTSIALSMNMMFRVTAYQIKTILEEVEKKYFKSGNLDSYKSDVVGCIKIIKENLQSVPSKLRLIVNELCLDVIKTKNFFSSTQLDEIMFIFWKLELLNKMSTDIREVCDCSFFYWYRDLIPECLNYYYSNPDEFKRIQYFNFAISDIDNLLTHVRYVEDNTTVIKKLRENVKKIYIEEIGLKIARDVENDLRVQVHSIMISNLNLPNPCKGELKEVRRYLTTKQLTLFDSYFNIKSFVEENLNRTFYDMTALNLNDWKTYQQMRVLAKTKFNLSLHDVNLPNQTLDQGIDILFILRNMVSFVQQYTYNLHSQTFTEIMKDNNYVTSIGVQQILNSLCTHGIGVVNTIVNKTYQFLGQRIKAISQFVLDEYIKSSLMLEKRYWLDNKEHIHNRYPYERAENLCNDIKNLIKSKDEITLLDKLRGFITQIGNALGFIRIIRASLIDYSTQNLKFFSGNENQYEEILKNLSSIEIEDEGTKVSFTNTNKIFQESLNLLDQNKKEAVNYLTLLVDTFENIFQNIPDLDLFFYLIPAVSINYIENLIKAKDKIIKINVKDAYFSDDGFILGVSYLLKIFKQENSLDSLHWFQSVIEKFENDSKQFSQHKVKKTQDDLLQQNMSLRKINTYKNEFELLYFTYNTARIVFNDY
jgi:WASH complex subunit 7